MLACMINNMNKQSKQKYKPNLEEIPERYYRQEAMIIEPDRRRDDKIWDCGSPLYDSFELASLSNSLERHLMALPFTENPPKIYEGFDENSEEKKVQIAKVKKRNKLRLLRAVLNALAFWKKGL
jgi:hypothetical protein